MNLKIKDWDKIQHYKKRNPPWIKFYRDILNDPNIFNISDAAYKLLTFCWLLASEQESHNGLLPPIETIAFRCRIEKCNVIQLLNELKPFILEISDQDASNMLATCYQDASNILSQRQRKEGEGEEEGYCKSEEVFSDKKTSEQTNNNFSSSKKVIKLNNPDLLNDFVIEIKNSRLYDSINIDQEILNLQRWLLNKPDFELTQNFVIDWLTKADTIQKAKLPQKLEPRWIETSKERLLF